MSCFLTLQMIRSSARVLLSTSSISVSGRAFAQPLVLHTRASEHAQFLPRGIGLDGRRDRHACMYAILSLNALIGRPYHDRKTIQLVSFVVGILRRCGVVWMSSKCHRIFIAVIAHSRKTKDQGMANRPKESFLNE